MISPCLRLSLAFAASLAVSPGGAASDVRPRWIQSLSNNAIIPGGGLAGIRFGDRTQRVRTVLGPPTVERPLRLPSGEFISTVWNYQWEGRTLTLSFNAGGQLFGMRLSDDRFNADKALSIRGTVVIPGSSVREVMRIRPKRTDIDDHVTCPGEIADGVAYDWNFPGITYCVCGNGKVYWIDVKR